MARTEPPTPRHRRHGWPHSQTGRALDVAFRYRGANPALAWSPDDHLHISVEGPVDLDKQLITLHSFSIDYSLSESSNP